MSNFKIIAYNYMISRYFMNWLTKYKDKLGIRYATFEKLFIIAKKRNLKIIKPMNKAINISI